MIKDAKSEVLDETNREASRIRKETQQQLQADKVSLVTVFGVFASIISLLTIEFRFLRAFDDPLQIVGFSFVLLASLLSFNIALDYLVKSRVDPGITRPHWVFLLILGGLFGLGLFLLCHNH